MKLKLAYERSSGRPADIVVTADTVVQVGEVANWIASVDPLARPAEVESLTLSVAAPGETDFTVLDPARAIGEVAVASGFTVRLVGASGQRPASSGRAVRATLRVVGGPESGREFPLAPGTYTLGRDASCDLVLADDPMVSKQHARVVVGATVEVVDQNSANGLLVDGGLVPRVGLLPGQTVTLGDSVLTVEFASSMPALAYERVVQSGAVPFNRSPRVQPRYPGAQHPRPAVPKEIEKQPFPWLLMVAPIVMGVSMYLVTHNPLSLLFVAMTPMMMLGNYLMSRQRTRRQTDKQVERFTEQLERLRAWFVEETPIERQVRDLEVPSVSEALEAGLNHRQDLFTRRPEHWNFLHLRLGTGRWLSRNSVAAASEQDEGLPEFTDQLESLVAAHRFIDGLPLTEDPLLAGALGVVGPRREAAAVLRGLLVQLTAAHSPAELVTVAMVGAPYADEFAWLKWLPHTSSPQSPLTASPLADSAASVGLLLAQLEELVAVRSAAVDAEARGPLSAELLATVAGAVVGQKEATPPALPVVVVLIAEDAPADRARLVQLTERAAAAGVIPLWLAGTSNGLPAGCRTFLDVTAGSQHGLVGYVRHGVSIPDVVAESVSREEALRFARALSGLVDSGALITDDSDIPRTVPLLSLVGEEMAERADAVVDRWRQNESMHDRSGGKPRPSKRKPSLRALVGQSSLDAMHLDLRSHGPHALVGGTPGSGKSEFLQAWVLGMAAEYSPDRLTFLFVDYKGGAAFADCIKLPHCVGLVTDLSQHLVRRALTSLRAELKHREHVLNQKKAKDLLELERRGDPECPPALVLVIDEFAALVGEIPEFLDGVVDIAQRGRSLGIHVIMATQRPAGVIRDNLRANTNLRIALRMADEVDSNDVIGSSEAAFFDPAIPGRAVAKTGPGRLVAFQSAYAGGWSGRGETEHEIAVHELRFGAETPWLPKKPDVALDPDSADLGPTDQSRLVATIEAAARRAELPVPRRPWLNELRKVIDLVELGPRNDSRLPLGRGDQPDLQRQEIVHFCPDTDGNLAVFGTGGSGKSVVLRTLAAAAGVTPRGGPVDVYALDFASGGLRMLETLPHVGAVITGDDTERVIRLFRTLKDTLDERAKRYPSVNAGSVAEYRINASAPMERRILLLVDGFPAFRAEFEVGAGRAAAYATFQQILSEGRALGMHVVFTADRPGAVPGAVASSVPRRIVLRMAEETMYTLLDVDSDILSSSSPPGRAIIDGVEVQIGLMGGSPNLADQSSALIALGEAIRKTGRPDAAGVGSLPERIDPLELPDSWSGLPVLGLGDETLGPVGFAPEGVVLVAGPPGSGRSNAVAYLAKAVARACPDERMYYLGSRRSGLANEPLWTDVALDPDAAAELAKRLRDEVGLADAAHLTVVVEGLSDFLSSPADGALVDLFKAIKRSDHLLIAESETSTWTTSWALLAEVKAARRGLLLQPESIEGDTILRTTLPRVSRSDFPVGRGFWVDRGKVQRVQVPMAAETGSSPHSGR